MYVYVVDQSDTARQRGVIVERTQSGSSVISTGIHEGDRVVTDGQLRLTPDAPVRLRGASDMGGGAAAARPAVGVDAVVAAAAAGRDGRSGRQRGKTRRVTA